MNKKGGKGAVIFLILMILFMLVIGKMTIDDMQRQLKKEESCKDFCYPEDYYFSLGNIFTDDVCECDTWRGNKQ